MKNKRNYPLGKSSNIQSKYSRSWGKIDGPSTYTLVRDSSAVRRLFSTCCSRRTSGSSAYGKQRICPPTLGQHISTFRGYLILFSIRNPYINRFTNHFFYSFITILPSESGVTLHYSTSHGYSKSTKAVGRQRNLGLIYMAAHLSDTSLTKR